MGQKDSKNMIGRENQIVIGIDFGSCGITFAYGFLDDPTKTINPGRFEEQGINNKVSTEIIINEDYSKVLCFGNECQTKLHSTDTRKFLHFKNVKMNLYKRKYKIKANNSNEEVDIEKIITIILKEVKKKAMEQIKCRLPKLKEKNILHHFYMYFLGIRYSIYHHNYMYILHLFHILLCIFSFVLLNN